MIKIAKSKRNRTCCECGCTIQAREYHFETRGGPEKSNYSGRKNNWVEFVHVRCVRKLVRKAHIMNN